MNETWIRELSTWLATYALHSTLLLVGAWALTRLSGLRGPRSSEVVWRAALFGGVLTATLHVVLGAPLWRAPIVERAAPAPVPTVASPAIAAEIRVEAPPPAEATLPTPSAERVAPAPAAPPDPAWLLLLWPLGGLVLLGRSRRSRQRLAHALDGRRDADDEALTTLARRLAREAGVERPVRLTVSPRLGSPVALGTRRPEICLPARALHELGPAHLEAMLAHEAAHLARRDPLWLRAYRAASALLFFQPLNHLAVARLRDASELLCDAWAATSPPRRVALAECLTIVADWIVEGRQPQAAPAMARRTSKLGARVSALLAAEPPHRARGRAGLGLLALAPLALVAALAPGLSATAALRGPTTPLEEPVGTDPVALLDAELALLAEEVAELSALLETTDRPKLARRIESHLKTLEARHHALRAALAAKGR